MTASTEWQPRWVAYARVQGRSPEDQEALIRHVPGHNAAFMAWIDDRWSEWSAEIGREPGPTGSQELHDAFDAWLAGWTPEQANGAGT